MAKQRKQKGGGKRDVAGRKVRATGSTSENFHGGARSEYLAQYVFSSFGTSVPIPRQEDTGIDLYCTLTKRIGKLMWPEVYYSVQVKSDDSALVLQGEDSIRWLIEHPMPLFFCIVSKETARLRVYQMSPRLHVVAHSPLPSQLELIPEDGSVGSPLLWDGDSTKFGLSAPILDFDIPTMRDDGFVEKAKDVLKFWALLEMENLRRLKAGMRMYTMPTRYETNRPGTTGRWRRQGLCFPSVANLHSVIRELKDYLNWMFVAAGWHNPRIAARVMLLQDSLYPHEPGRVDDTMPYLGMLRSKINEALIGTPDNDHFVGVRQLGAELDRKLAAELHLGSAPVSNVSLGGDEFSVLSSWSSYSDEHGLGDWCDRYQSTRADLERLGEERFWICEMDWRMQVPAADGAPITVQSGFRVTRHASGEKLAPGATDASRMSEESIRADFKKQADLCLAELQRCLNSSSERVNAQGSQTPSGRSEAD